MKHRRQIAAALACALVLGLCGGAALATDPIQDGTAQPPLLISPAPANRDTAAEVTPAVSQTDSSESSVPAESESVPDADGTISFTNLGSRVSSGNLTYLMLEEHIAQAEATDYEKLKEQLRKDINAIARTQFGMLTGSSNIATGIPDLDQALQGIYEISSSSTLQSLQSAYDAMKEQYDMLRDGEIQAEAADGIRQLRNTQNTLVMGAEAMYIGLLGAQIQGQTVDRSLASLERTLQELEVRYEMGQVSALTLQQTKSGRTQLLSGQQTLIMSLKNLTMQLESMIGAELTGTSQLTALPLVSAEQLSAMALETDLTAAKAASYDLYIAKKTLDDAQEAFEDAGKEYGYNTQKTEYIQAQHAWQAAQYTYAATVQSYELSFQTLYAQVKDYAQILGAAETSLAVEEANYAADQLKYEQGIISKNALLTAEDDLNAARDTVATAQLNLFSAYNNYRWAVDHGILN